ncbi:cytochrome P450 [Lactarius psammicola]|nr:cytochrome P450 [Lactarius psammicola]
MLVIELFVLLSSLVALRAFWDYRRRRGRPYPPGPRPLPFIGNFFDIPNDFSWLAYTEFSKKYGDILSFHIFGQVIVVLSSTKATKDLLEKRGDIYSDRPVIPFYEMMEFQWVLPLARYAEQWRLGRKLLDRGLGAGAASAYRPLQQLKTRLLLTRLLASPQQWEAHIELLQGELTLDMTYGYEVQGRDDRLVEAARKASQMGAKTALPSDLLVNGLPFLRHIPEWLPWFSYKPLARIGRDIGKEVKHGPIRFVRESMLNGTARPSLALKNLQEAERLSGSERVKVETTIQETLASLYAAAADTTVSAILTAFLALLLRPDLQIRAQAELDAVIGRERLPTFEDRPRLPFIDAVCKEALRWRPVTPLALPHAATEDNVYEGFFIPKGALVIGNTWAILRDPAVYPEPDTFKPERFLNQDGTLRDDPVLMSAFGYGKRMCPGKHFADATLFIVIASVLSVFNIRRPDPESGPFSYSYTGSLASQPNPFPCLITPRDKTAEELIVFADSMAH